MKTRLLIVLMLLPSAVAAQEFEYMPAGQLVDGSGQGRPDDTVYVPDMRFPIEVAPAYPNSQVWGVGGSQGPGGGQCDQRNYSYPWWDNFCESRSWDMPLCPSGNGHQGQDIRPSSCEDNVHWTVAAESGQISNIGSYSVWLVSDNGTQHRYLHMERTSLQINEGDRVEKGDRLGRVSNEFGGTSTTIHLHYDLNQNIPSAGGNVYVPTYMSLIRSYEQLIGAEAEPCEVIGAEGGIVDDFGPCAYFFGPGEFWRTEDGGTEGQFHWTNAFANETPSNWARWSFHFAEAGEYRVEFNVVPPYNLSKKARYMVRHNGEETETEVDLTTVDDWHTLGEFQFAEGGDQRVEVYDNSGEEGEDLHITADAIRLTRLDLPGADMGGNGGDEDMGGGGNEGGEDMGGGGGGGTTTGADTGPGGGNADARVNRGCCRVVGAGRSPAWGWALALVALVLLRRRD